MEDSDHKTRVILRPNPAFVREDHRGRVSRQPPHSYGGHSGMPHHQQPGDHNIQPPSTLRAAAPPFVPQLPVAASYHPSQHHHMHHHVGGGGGYPHVHHPQQPTASYPPHQAAAVIVHPRFKGPPLGSLFDQPAAAGFLPPPGGGGPLYGLHPADATGAAAQMEPADIAHMKLKKRCANFPNCRFGDQCRYIHPTEMCENWPNCSFGAECFYIHPEVKCKYGINCFNSNCNYTHPEGWNPVHCVASGSRGVFFKNRTLLLNSLSSPTADQATVDPSKWNNEGVTCDKFDEEVAQISSTLPLTPPGMKKGRSFREGEEPPSVLDLPPSLGV